MCRLVEVKCYQAVHDLFGSASVRQKIAEQIAESEKVLAGHFDLDLDIGGRRRPDHVVKARELTVLLDFYLARAERYGLFAPDAAEEARFFLRTIDEGYSLRFTRTGLMFDFAKAGLDQPDEELGVEFHRIGVDRIRALVDAACAARAEPAMAEAPAESFAPPSCAIEVSRTAAFLSPPRDRTVDWKSVSTLTSHRLGPAKGATTTPAVDAAVSAGIPAEASSPAQDNPPGNGRGQTTREASVSPETEPSSAAGEPVAASPAGYDVLLGTRGNSPQYGILGETEGRKIALDLNETHTRPCAAPGGPPPAQDRPGSERDPYHQSVRRSGGRQELHAGEHRRDGTPPHPWDQHPPETPGRHFALLFTAPTWAHVQMLLTGTLLAQGPRTVARGLARDGAGPRAALRALPSGAKPSALVGPARRADSVRAADRLVAARLAARGGGGRNTGAAHRGADCR